MKLIIYFRKRGIQYLKLAFNLFKPLGRAKVSNAKGFTLVEVLVTVGIAGLIASISLPAYDRYRQKAADRVVHLEAQNYMKNFRACIGAEEDIETCASNHIGYSLFKDGADADTKEKLECRKKDTAKIKIDKKLFKDGDDTFSSCFYSHDASFNEVAFGSIAITGGYGAGYCVSYNVESTLVTKQKYSAKYSKEIQLFNNGKCADPPSATP